MDTSNKLDKKALKLSYQLNYMQEKDDAILARPESLSRLAYARGGRGSRAFLSN